MPFSPPKGYKERTPQDFASWVATYADDYRRFDHGVLLAYIDGEALALGAMLELQVSLDEQGVRDEDVPPPIVAALAGTWDSYLFRAAVCAAVTLQLIGERPPGDELPAFATAMSALANAAWLLATDHHVCDPTIGEPNPALLPEFCNVPEAVRSWMREEYERQSEELFRRHGLDAESGDLTAAEKARLEQLRRRLKERGDAPA